MPLCSLVSLPPDILITICIHLLPSDLLSFIQTCRVLHALGSTDYVWHQTNIDLSLDTTGPLADLPAFEIKAAVVRALRLDKNWNKRVSKLFRITRARPRNAVVEMQPLGRHWLVTSHRSRGASINLSVWRLDTDNLPVIGTTCIIAFQPNNAFSFQAAFREGQDSALISVLGGSSLSSHKGQWTLYDLNLKGKRRGSLDNPYTEPILSKEFSIEHSGVPYFSQVSGSIAAVAIVHVGPGSCSHEIVLLNTTTNVILKIDSQTITNFDCGRLQFKLYPPYIVIIGTLLEKIKVNVRKLPTEIFSDTVIPQRFAENTLRSVKWDAHIADFETTKISNLEFCIPNEPIYPGTPLESITIVVDHSPFSTMENGNVDVFRFPIDVSKRDLQFNNWQPTFSFSTQPNVSLEPVCLGKTGTRAVWLSHQWNTDEYQLMKGHFPKSREAPLVVPLQPPDSPLPFESRACRALAFEEATGRLFVGVHTGDIYVLEYNKQ